MRIVKKEIEQMTIYFSTDEFEDVLKYCSQADLTITKCTPLRDARSGRYTSEAVIIAEGPLVVDKDIEI